MTWISTGEVALAVMGIWGGKYSFVLVLLSGVGGIVDLQAPWLLCVQTCRLEQSSCGLLVLP